MVDLPEEIKELAGIRPKEIKDVERTVENNLSILKKQGERILESYDRYCKSDDMRLRDDLGEAIASRLNHYVQAFKDIVAYVQINEEGYLENDSLSYLKRVLQSKDIKISQDGEKALEYMQRRNSPIHDYFNIDKLNQEMLKGVASYGNGFVELADTIRDYCLEKFSDRLMQDNVKKVIKAKRR